MISSYQTVPLPIVGPSGEHQDSSYSNQITMNYRVEAHKTGSHSIVLVPWPGSKAFAAIDGTTPRGVHFYGGVLYKISNTDFYSVDSLGVETLLGTIAGTDRCIMADNGTELIIATGSMWYQWNGSTLTSFSPPTLSTGASASAGNSVDFISGFACYDIGNGRFIVADFGDPDSFQNNNFGTAESSPDNLKRVYEFNERLYLMGDETIETWYLSTGNPPLTKTQNGTMQVGLGDLHSVAKTTDYVYFRGNDGWVYRFSSNQAVNVTSGFAAQAFENYPQDSAVAWVIDLQGVSYYVISFTQNNSTWVFSERSHQNSPGVNDWVQLSTGADQDRYLGEMYVRAYNKHLIEKKGTGDILELDVNTFTDDSDTIVRVRESAPIHGGLLGKEGARLEMSWVTIVLKKGVGTASGGGVDPRLYFQGSFDGGDSYSNEEEVEIGRTGQSLFKVTWYHCESFYEASFRVTGYDPVYYSIHGASIGLKFVGD